MTPARGFFSVIQFCPDLDRGEFVNVGVVLVVPERQVLEVRMSPDNEGPKQRFGADSFDEGRLTLAKRGLEGRIHSEAPSLTTPGALERLASLEGNKLLVSSPRTIFVEDAAADMEELYQRFVFVAARQRRRQQPPPDLIALFETPLAKVPLMKDYEVELPEVGVVRVPYAYKNGVLNLVKPEGFPLEEKAVEAKANALAVQGHLIHKQSKDSDLPKKLIVVGAFDTSVPEAVKRRLQFVLEGHDTRLVRSEDLGAFVEEVRRDAHY